MNPRKSGFSLIELLIVVAIIAILVGMIVPIVQFVRERATQTNCFSNMRQLGTAFELYKNKWGGWYPHEDRDSLAKNTSLEKGNFSWFDVLDPFINAEGNLSRVKQCPAWLGYEETAGQFQTADKHSIKMNSKLSQGILRSPLAGWTGPFPHDAEKHHFYWVPVQLIKKPQLTILLIDGRTDGSQGGHIISYIGRVSCRHMGGTNILFVDLHCEWYDAEGNGVAKPGGLGWNKEGGGYIWDPYE
ncbi:type II secretion system protein [bacterium AH-315-M10]|nr:type II secretion system protein [bacterium AH-315-M10]